MFSKKKVRARVFLLRFSVRRNTVLKKKKKRENNYSIDLISGPGLRGLVTRKGI